MADAPKRTGNATDRVRAVRDRKLERPAPGSGAGRKPGRDGTEDAAPGTTTPA